MYDQRNRTALLFYINQKPQCLSRSSRVFLVVFTKNSAKHPMFMRVLMGSRVIRKGRASRFTPGDAHRSGDILLNRTISDLHLRQVRVGDWKVMEAYGNPR